MNRVHLRLLKISIVLAIAILLVVALRGRIFPFLNTSSDVPTLHPAVVIGSSANGANTTDATSTTYAFGGWLWTDNWGALSMANGTLDFGASSSTTGGTILAANVRTFTNYEMKASVAWMKGETFGMLVRFLDLKNFAYCNFGDRYVSVVVRANGTDITAAGASVSQGLIGHSEDLGVKIFGNKMGCSVGGVDVVSAVVAQGMPQGSGIGFTAWEPAVGASRVIIDQFSLMPLATDTIMVGGSGKPAATTPAQSAPVASSSVPVATTTSVVPPFSTPRTLPYLKTDFSGDVDWMRTWGNVTTTASGELIIGAANNTTGGGAYLNNTSAWSKYHFTAMLDWPKGENFMLFTNYIDDQNFVACSYSILNASEVQIALQQRIKGTDYRLAEGKDQNFNIEGRTNVQAGIEVNDTRGTCSLNNHLVANTSADSYTVNPPFAGGIGFSTWDPAIGNVEIDIKKVAVQ